MSSSVRSPVKKWVMRQYWRMQQSQSVLSLGLLGSSLTLLIWPYIKFRFEGTPSVLGIPTTYIGLLGIFSTLIMIVLLIGFLYDRVFSLWTELRSVDLERNPYWTYALSPTWMMSLATNAQVMKNTTDDVKIQQDADWILNWCKEYSQNEMFARSVQHWDKYLKTTPTFWFLDENIMEAARSLKIEDDD